MEILARTNTEADRDWVVGAVIFNDRGQIYFHRRTFERRLFPGCWDIVGGHVEPGETILEALTREIDEETGWKLAEVATLLLELEWTAAGEHGPVHKREFDFVVRVEGDLVHPKLEEGKHDDFAWVSAGSLDILKENRMPNDTFITDLAERGFAYLRQGRDANRRHLGQPE